MNEKPNNGRSSFVGRRRFIAGGAWISSAFLSGCTSGSLRLNGNGISRENEDDISPPPGATPANFRLLISDLPADIGDFESLEVFFSSARIFDAQNRIDDGDAETDDTGSEGNETENSQTNETGGQLANTVNGDVEGENDQDDQIERRRGFYVLDLDGDSVDLTEVVGAKAKAVFEGRLAEGTYRKIELHVSEVIGILEDGEEVEIQVPSEKLQITHSFEVGGDESVEFVFDINVVRRGQGTRYNLMPVISGSGVIGDDVKNHEVINADPSDD